MKEKLSSFPRIKLAKQLLGTVKGKKLSLEERRKLTVELAGHILASAIHVQAPEDKREQAELAEMMNDPTGKFFANALVDQSFRSKKHARIANQMVHVLQSVGIPRYLPLSKKLPLLLFKMLGEKLPNIFVPLAMYFLRKQTSKVIIAGEKSALSAHIKRRKEQGIRLNINHLGEAILGEKEAEKRLKVYLDDLKNPAIDYVSIKISTIYSQINPLSWEQTVEAVAAKLRILYREAIKNPYTTHDGKKAAKFVNLDMEEYKDLHLTKEIFMRVLDEEEFKHYSAGIVLQAYLPDGLVIQKELTEWAKQRLANGGAPIKVRIVKGANLAMEQFEASLRGWEQTPYTSKIESDANYKKMVLYAFEKEHARCVNIGVGSHNIFDIAYALILRAENEIEEHIAFEMLEGMADHMRQVIQELSGGILLYCAVATKADFQSAIAYLIRRLDENTGPENFLRQMFGLKPGTEQWDAQALFFNEAAKDIESVPVGARRSQDRTKPPKPTSISDPFENEPDTDLALPQNIAWAHDLIEEYENKTYEDIPLVIGGEEIHQDKPEGEGFDPSKPGKVIYRFSMATDEQVDTALKVAKEAESSWAAKSIDERCEIIHKAAHIFREKRREFQGMMMADGGKTLYEADIEYSEAIDFAEYYVRSLKRYEGFNDVSFSPKGTILVTPPWNFPVSIPAGGVIAALITGNCVIFKPAPETVLSGWETAKVLWEAGVPKNVLQFINCPDEPVGSNLIKDTRVDGVILTGATATAKLFLKLRPGLNLSAETGGKNALIITAVADRDLAIKDLVMSFVGHNGQKCSAASLAILEKEVYDDKHFMQQLKDATESLTVGPAWHFKTKVSPLIREPGKELKRGFTQLEPGESWLVEPKQDPNNPCLWSPGIKIGVKKGNYTQQTELFGPVLGIIRANNLDHAIQIANATPYGLTSGIHTLDHREQLKWQSKIVAGNCYINRTITGAIVQRQPFGGCKQSCFGNGAKAGGPNYLLQFMHIKQNGLPKEKAPVNDWVNKLSRYLEKFDLCAEELGLWYASIANYSFWKQHFKKDYDPTKIVGQDNYQRYVPHKKVVVRITQEDKVVDYLRILAAALTAETPLQVSFKPEGKEFPPKANWQLLLPIFNIVEETDEEFTKRVKSGDIKRVRMLGKPSEELILASSCSACYLDTSPVLANGRLELLHYLREVSLSIDYHRYGNLGLRENEIRKPIL